MEVYNMNNFCKTCGSPISVTSIGNYACYNCHHRGNIFEEYFSSATANITADPPYLAGWTCPKCGAVMSPYQTHCVKCTKLELTCK